MLPKQNLINVVKGAVQGYGKDDISNLAAALAFAAFFSIFPLILFIVSLASFFLNQQQAADFVLTKLPNLQSRGTDANFLAKTVTDIIASRGAGTGIAAIVGLVSLLMSASGVFGTLMTAINRAWECEKAASLVKDKVVAFIMVLGVALVMVLSTVVSSILAGIQKGTAGLIGDLPWLWQILNQLAFVALMTGVLTILYRSIPRCKVNWADVWPAALITAILFAVVNQLFAFYLGNFANYQAVYGTLGAVIALQTWIFVMSQILLFGAEFCSHYAKERGAIEQARAEKANATAARQRQVARASRMPAGRAPAGARERAAVERSVRTVPEGAPPREQGLVFATAAGVAAAIGVLAKVLAQRGSHRA